MKNISRLLLAIILTSVAFLQSGCSSLNDFILYSDLTFRHENDYPEGTMSVARSTPYGVAENEKRFLTDAAVAWCKAKGKVMVPISVRFLPPHGEQPSHTTVLFRAMNPNDPSLNKPDLSPIRPQTTFFN
jgi:hypothetical protein